MKSYNEPFLNSIDYKKYLDNDTIIRLLDDRLKNNDDSDFQMDYQELIGITAIDHYMIKKIIANEQIIPGSNFDIYIKKIRSLLQQQPLLLLQLPIKDIEIEQLKKYIPEIGFIKNSIINKRNNIHIIYNKFKQNPGILTIEEKKKMIEYFSYNVPTTNQSLKNAQEHLVKYLLNETDALSFNASSFVIKYLGYEQANKKGLDDTLIFIGKLETENNFGKSFGSSVVINKNMLKKVTFKNNNLEDMYGRRKDGKKEGLAILQTLFHELQHQVQSKEMLTNQKSDMSYYMLVRSLIGAYQDKDEYYRNYGFQEIEKDANLAGWIGVQEVINNYMPNYKKSYALTRAFKYKYIEFIQNKLGNRKDTNNKMIYSSDLLVKSLDEILKQHPELLQRYPQLQEYYNDAFKPKSCIQLLNKNDFQVTLSDFYLGEVIYRLRDGLTKMETDKLSTLDKKNVIKNINQIFYMVYRKISIMTLYINDYKKGIQNINDKQLEMFDLNIQKYKSVIIMLYSYVNKMLATYNELKDPNLNIDFYINGNTGINMYYQKIRNHIEEYESLKEDKEVKRGL